MMRMDESGAGEYSRSTAPEPDMGGRRSKLKGFLKDVASYGNPKLRQEARKDMAALTESTPEMTIRALERKWRR